MLAVGIGNLSFALLLAAYIRCTANSPALPVWMWARMAFGLTQLLAYARPLEGSPLLAAMESAGWVAGLTLESTAYAIFFGYKNWRRTLVPVWGLCLLLACAATLNGFAYAQLIGAVSLVMGCGTLLAGMMLVHPHLHGITPLKRLIGASDLVSGAGLALWGCIVAAGMPEPEWGRTVAYISGYLLMLVNGFGFMLMSKQRDDARMERLATTDDLTGLLNRRAFYAQTEAARMLALRQAQPMALLMLDIDHFKQLNDRFGHATGDEALVKFAATCHAALREHDILGRMGGEEFALALPGTDLAGAVNAAERLRQAVVDTRLLTCGNQYTMTVSIGLVVIEPDEALSAALARADQALYAAKRGGRNRVEVGPTRRCA
ncbi:MULTISPECIES: diguanylate cyclase [unclassified Massilia]|uniref:GGDEF domain-containing protein n=1 Tax=unclassified Massilia TaxID=2609279 RepID=UPI001E3DACE1|nr:MULTISPECIES: GGDEF domain-containing protein [unclassified Massilia]